MLVKRFYCSAYPSGLVRSRICGLVPCPVFVLVPPVDPVPPPPRLPRDVADVEYAEVGSGGAR